MLQKLKNLYKKIFFHIEAYAHSKHKMKILFLVSFFEQSFSPILPDLLIIPISMYKKYTALYVSAFAAFAAALGGVFSYFLGYFFGSKIIDYFNLASYLEPTQNAFKENAFFAMSFVAFTPIPDRIFSLFAGVFHVNIVIFFVALFLGKFLRFYIVANVSEKYGAEARDLVLKRFNMFMFVFTVLLILMVLYYFIIMR
jgi:membrane protein YqaA with SNARE-associated domain